MFTYLLGAVIAAVIGIVAGFSIGTGWRAYTVHGGSMEPHYQQGDLIVTSALDARSAEPGQIIVFTADWASERYNQRVVHRIIAVGSADGVPFAYTRGDANTIDDPQPVDLTASSVRVVRFSVSNGAFWLAQLTAPYALAGFVALLGLAATTVLMKTGLPLPGLRRARQLTPAAPERHVVEQRERAY